MDTWKISKNDDTAVMDALCDFVVSVNMTVPQVKTNYVEIDGMNGSIDMSGIYGEPKYNDRIVSLILITKMGLSAPSTSVDSFVNKYVGDKIRLHNVTKSFILIGRITDTQITSVGTGTAYKMICTVQTEPLKYDAGYTPNSTGLTVNPQEWSSSIWSTANVSSLTSGATVSLLGGTIPTTITRATFRLSASAHTDNAVLLIVLEDMASVCLIDTVSGNAVKLSDTMFAVFAGTDAVDITILRVASESVTFHAGIYEVETVAVTNTGKSTPLEISNSYSGIIGSEIYIAVNDGITRLPLTGFAEYADIILKSGENRIATFVNDYTFTPPTVHGSVKVRYRRGII